MQQYSNRLIINHSNNLLNLPDTIQFMNGNQIVNVYDAAGRKLYSKTYTFLQQLAQPVTQVLQLEPAPRHIEQITTVYNGNVTSTNRFGELAGYGTPQIHTIYNTEGYVMRQIYLRSYRQEYDYYYYRRDHLGNNVAVWNATADSTEQRTLYYASGLPMRESKGQEVQTRKYNGKEYHEIYGLNEYDYGFRGYYATIGRFSTIDPLAEKYPQISPYAYCANNPILFIDPNGLEKVTSFNDTIPTNTIFEEAAENYPENDDVIHIWAHGSSSSIEVITTDENGEQKKKIITDGKDMNEFLRKSSEIWKTHKDGEQIIIVLHSCETGQGDNSIAQKISGNTEFENTLIVAPTEIVAVSSKSKEELGTAKTVHTNDGNVIATDKNGQRIYGAWKIFHKGKQVNSFSGKTKPIFKKPKKHFERYGK